MALENLGTNMAAGRLDITVVVVTPSWSADVVNTNTGTTVSGQQVQLGTDLSIKGRLTGTDGQAIPNYWVSLDLIGKTGGTQEDGYQCWLGQSKTDSNGYFGTLYYFEARTDGWWSNYPGVDGAYIGSKNGANCQSWASTDPSGKSFSGYAAVSSSYYSSKVTFQIGPTTPICSVSGDTYINDVKVAAGQIIRTAPATKVEFIPPAGTTLSKVEIQATGTSAWTLTMTASSGGSVGAVTWASTGTWPVGTYTIKIIATCTAGGTQQVLSMGATITEGSDTEVTDYTTSMRTKLMMIGGTVLFTGLFAVGYGYRKDQK